jgi:hypothetical protein
MMCVIMSAFVAICNALHTALDCFHLRGRREEEEERRGGGGVEAAEYVNESSTGGMGIGMEGEG